jgi:hypothetical protein
MERLGTCYNRVIMSRDSKEPIWVTGLKVIAAALFALLALAVAVGGAVALWQCLPVIWDNMPHGGPHSVDGDMLVMYGTMGAVCGAVALGVAAVLGWSAFAMLRKRPTREM